MGEVVGHEVELGGVEGVARGGEEAGVGNGTYRVLPYSNEVESGAKNGEDGDRIKVGVFGIENGNVREESSCGH